MNRQNNFLNIAHRGLSGVFPENTPAAFRAALKAGVPMIETDVQLTGDQNVVICHDYNIKRLTGTDGFIDAMSLEDLKKLDFAGNDPSHEEREKILTLEELFDLVPPETVLNLEIKNYGRRSGALTERVCSIIEKKSREQRVIVSAYDHMVLQELSRIKPEIKTGILLYANLVEPLSYIKRLGFKPYSIHLAIEFTDEQLIKNLTSQGYKVFLYTVNSVSDYQFALDAGASGVISDNPEKFI